MTELPPYDEEAERAVLGAMLQNPNAVPAAQDYLNAEDFYTDKHRQIFQSVTRVWSEGRNLDHITISAELPEQRDYVHLLFDTCYVTTNVTEYARIVHDHAQRRLLLRTGQEIAQLAHRKDDIKKLVDLAEQKVYGISPTRVRKPEQVKDILARVISEQDDETPTHTLTTGFPRIDELVGGLHDSNLVIVGARPGIGKTSFGLAIAEHAAAAGRVLFFSLEMSRVELAERLGCSLASVSLRNLREHSLQAEELARLCNHMGHVEKLDLLIEDEPGQTLLSVRGTARREASKKHLSLIVIDYLQLMTLGYRTESRFVEVSAMSRELKNLARTLRCPVLALSQLNRESESHWSDGKPRLSHLRESGSIEQDADVVLLLSWPKDKPGFVNVDVAKNRHGPLGEVQLIWTPQYTRFGRV